MKQPGFLEIDRNHASPAALNSETVVQAALVMAAVLISAWFGQYVVVSESRDLTRLLELTLFIVLAVAVFWKPYLGVIITAASLPILELLPPIPLATSAVAAIGALTLVGYVAWQIRHQVTIRIHFQRQHILGLAFILWFFVTNPTAAWFGDRNWLWTYVQLWILLWLAGELLGSPDRQRMLIGVFALAAVFSALFALQEAVIGPSIKQTLRGVGFAAGANAAARYFTVALVFLNFFRETTTKPIIRLCTLVAMAVPLTGVIFTASRTGFFLLIITLGLILIKRAPRVQHRQLSLILMISLIVVVAIPGTYWELVNNFFLSSIKERTDTVGLRYGLWQAGLRMWADHPLRGVGVGQFAVELPFYGADLVPFHLLLNIGPHNMYMAVLSETGLIGLLLFVGMLSSSLLALWRASRQSDAATSHLARAWFIVLVVLLLAGITKHDQYDKLLWVVLGIGAASTWGRETGLSLTDRR